ncbi:MAG: hypothetical protein MI806_08980, partial [Minwuiales bacterium]|nr:hypothetical protein [Minwuiales bacterium]
MRPIPKLLAPAAIGAAVALYPAPPGSRAASSFEACVEQPSRQCLLAVAGAAATRTRLPATRAYLFTLIADAHAAADAVADAKRAVDAAVDAMVEIDDPEARLSALSSVAERYRALGSDAAAEAALAEAAGLLGDGLAGDAGDQAFSRLMRMWHLAAPLAALGPSDAFATTMERA